MQVTSMDNSKSSPLNQGANKSLQNHLLRNMDTVRKCVNKYLTPQFRSRESPADIVQSVCRQVLEYQGKFDYLGEAQFQAWLATIVRNKIIGKARHHFASVRDVRVEIGIEQGDALNIGSNETASRIMMREELNNAIDKAIGTLTPAQREIMLMSRVCEMSNDQIAARLGKEPGATRAILYRARVRLAAQLDSIVNTTES